MTHWSRRWRPPACAVSLLAAALVAAPLPALAAEPPLPALPSTQPSLVAQAHLAVARLAPTLKAGATTAQTATPSPGDVDRGRWSFFKSPMGIVVMSTFAVGAGYWVYSTQHDRVSSPGKD